MRATDLARLIRIEAAARAYFAAKDAYTNAAVRGSFPHDEVVTKHDALRAADKAARAALAEPPGTVARKGREW